MNGGSEGKTFWESLQNSYYGFCDWLQDHGIPIYDFFVYPLEDRGIPSLPAFVIILLLLLLSQRNFPHPKYAGYQYDSFYQCGR